MYGFTAFMPQQQRPEMPRTCHNSALDFRKMSINALHRPRPMQEKPEPFQNDKAALLK
jgi:hypothetical protein